ncbi:MAG: hypothetical protein AB8H03_05865 [Saprospiraceae bacterium]
MRQGRHYIISSDPQKGLREKVIKYYSDPIEYEYDLQNEVEIICISTFSDAINIFQKLNEDNRKNQSSKNLWYYILINKKGYEEFKSLRKEQKFNLLDLGNHNKKGVNMDKLEYHNISLNGGAIKAKKEYYETALDFWVSAVNKTQIDNSSIEVDLYGGSYNPISLETLKIVVSNSCTKIDNYINEDEFISSIEINNGPFSGTFFIETINEYTLIDVYCP